MLFNINDTNGLDKAYAAFQLLCDPGGIVCDLGGIIAILIKSAVSLKNPTFSWVFLCGICAELIFPAFQNFYLFPSSDLRGSVIFPAIDFLY
jgi:hypothetical protein